LDWIVNQFDWIVNQPAVFAALIQAIGTIVGAVVVGIAGTLLTRWFAKARDRQDRESQWRTHAVELTKLDIQRKIETWKEGDPRPRPAILDFLANYRDLQELGGKTPADLYLKIKEDRITVPTASQSGAPSTTRSTASADPSVYPVFKENGSFARFNSILHGIVTMLRGKRN
jgi:hypothetical protein